METGGLVILSYIQLPLTITMKVLSSSREKEGESGDWGPGHADLQLVRMETDGLSLTKEKKHSRKSKGMGCIVIYE